MQDRTSSLSAIILAGGKSTRMGIDKAFLKYEGRTFIEIIGEELQRLTQEVLLLIGTKNPGDFQSLLDRRWFRIMNDTHNIDNPLGGLLSALEHTASDYSGVVACDSPKIKSEVLNYLHDRAHGHSAAIPIWDIENRMTIEPLCAVYDVKEMRRAIQKAISSGRVGLKHATSFLEDVQYVPVDEIRRVDENLVSLLNINTKADYFQLIEEQERSMLERVLREPYLIAHVQ